MAGDDASGDPGRVPLGLHAVASAVRLAGAAVRRQARVRADDADVVAEHRARPGRRSHASLPAAVASLHRRRRSGTSIRYDTIRYDTRCYFNVRSKADISRLNLLHGNDN